MHAWGIVHELERRGVVLRDSNCVYRVLHELQARGFVRSRLQPSPAGGAARRVYRITPEGEQELDLEVVIAVRQLEVLSGHVPVASPAASTCRACGTSTRPGDVPCPGCGGCRVCGAPVVRARGRCSACYHYHHRRGKDRTVMPLPSPAEERVALDLCAPGASVAVHAPPSESGVSGAEVRQGGTSNASVAPGVPRASRASGDQAPGPGPAR